MEPVSDPEALTRSVFMDSEQEGKLAILFVCNLSDANVFFFVEN